MVIGLGGSCHWCTEGVFRSIKGVLEVEQGWLTSSKPHDSWSEGIRIKFDPAITSVEMLVAVHLHSHSCTSEHSMRTKYRSAIYFAEEETGREIEHSVGKLQSDFTKPIITQVLSLQDFKLNEPEFLDYYYQDPERPFCETYIAPKLKAIARRYPHVMNDRWHGVERKQK
jgi:peptide-methionine (S)-S-oxide reductase